MNEVSVGSVSDYVDPGRKVLDIDGFEIAVFLLDGNFYAYENFCPHYGGPACQGKLLPLTVEDVGPDKLGNGRIFSKEHSNVVCPWHGMEFDIRTGQHPMKSRFRLRRIAVRREQDEIFVSVPEKNERYAI